MKTDKIDTLKEVIEALKVQQKLIGNLKKSSKTLCEISDINLESYNDFLNKKEASYPDDIGKIELIARYTFFGTMLGVIDLKIDKLKSKLKSRDCQIGV